MGEPAERSRATWRRTDDLEELRHTFKELVHVRPLEHAHPMRDSTERHIKREVVSQALVRRGRMD
jgi:hypothetical protein